MGRRDTREFRLHRHAETPLAILVSDDGEESNAVWLPLSQVTIIREIGADIVEVEVPEWLAEDKGLP